MNYWLVVGSPENWQTAFEQRNIWGLRETQRHLWERLNEQDKLIFWATQPVGGIIGHGVVRTKVKQDRPLWPQETRERKVIWPLRFEFDAQSCLPRDKWKTERLASKELMPRAGFQQLRKEIAEELISSFTSGEYLVEDLRNAVIAEKPGDLVAVSEQPMRGLASHNKVRKTLAEIGRLQQFIADEEYAFDIGRLDVVWRRVQQSVPTYVFEIQIGGDVYHALAKLKHAYDLWNSHIFIVTSEADFGKVENLLSGTFHEIGSRLKVIDLQKVAELHRRKKAYRELERDLGIF